ncbi:MAG: hypothetical protein B0D96_13230 [Candidatus Sedimenticola endophacoides]|nr:MAG: hypothetical protein B0D94_03840 [Candidatus Sedimenticola endophacoides]OQX32684.1 MAG: hypothetical protein B0D96_13230 [Candidatus Sedimenticola endophacoides]OQX43899.1 MAG: hypothetical protein B0D86_06745 [Candidatus Sedimenticola endophacoides]OQX44160.1 MAG: hypothetical protein B0D88_03065 [Candidatus Sedimenticola endophacoides]OQX47445.1 MAG: hypothetical protein B0D85_01415 [Candidatus Sedimenticola endophacoides]
MLPITGRLRRTPKQPTRRCGQHRSGISTRGNLLHPTLNIRLWRLQGETKPGNQVALRIEPAGAITIESRNSRTALRATIEIIDNIVGCLCPGSA